ncbi:MAG: hypothetical protein PHF67_04185 [Candidatus Nanoarchaeia archaeon]|nr:hypothetical protein [Candidatus Nanoarchaeia archaeon]
MRIERKGADKISISHNKPLLILIIILIIILGFVIYSILKNKSENVIEKECEIDEDCIASSCCHPESCTIKDKAQVCEKIFCSQVCSGPLDCGAGHCGCVEGKCLVVENK